MENKNKCCVCFELHWHNAFPCLQSPYPHSPPPTHSSTQAPSQLMVHLCNMFWFIQQPLFRTHCYVDVNNYMQQTEKLKEKKPQVQATRAHDSLWHLFLQEESLNATDCFTPDSSSPFWRSICLMRVHRWVAARLNASLISWLPSLPKSHHVTSMKDLLGCFFLFLFFTRVCCKHFKKTKEKQTMDAKRALTSPHRQLFPSHCYGDGPYGGHEVN